MHKAYTTFNYSALTVTSAPLNVSTYASGPDDEGGPIDLYDDLLKFTAQITNTGGVAGSEVAQLYLGFPESAKSPVKQLRGFAKVSLEPGQSKPIEIKLQRRDVSIWDTSAQKWKIESGTYTALLGKSSRNIASNVTFQL